MSYAVEIKNINHKFKDKVICDNISINFEENKIYGLLGKNGVGKSTLLSIITNQLIPKEGEIKVLGIDIKDNPSILEEVCIVREKELFNKGDRIKNILKIYSYYYKNYDKELEKKLCKHFDINIKLVYSKLSRGQKTILSNIIGICSNAKVTIFDEPTVGLDAVNRRQFYDILLQNYMDKNRTIIICTHLIDEIQELLEKVIIIKDAKVEIDDDIDNIIQKSVYITGDKESLSKLSILKDKTPSKVFGNTYTYSYYKDIPKEDIEIIKELNIKVDLMPIQDMFIEMNKREVF